MQEHEEIRMPEEPGRLNAHAPVEVLLRIRTSQGEERPVLIGRTSTPYLRPNGAIVVVRPPFDANRMPPLKRADNLRANFRRSQNEIFEAMGTVSWVRPKAFLPSGLAVSFIGITFDGDPDDRALELAAFLSRESLMPPG
jgi:hypothetical protein